MNGTTLSKKKCKESRHRNWCFTSYKDEIGPVPSGTSYIIYQQECCPKTGKLHWQGYVEFNESVTMGSVKNKFNDRTIHLETRKGTQESAIKYCEKSETAVAGTRFRWGEPAKQGKRSDLNSLVEDLMQGATSAELLFKYKSNAFRHLHFIQRTQKILLGKNEEDESILSLRNTDHIEHIAKLVQKEYPDQLDNIYVKRHRDNVIATNIVRTAGVNINHYLGDENAYRVAIIECSPEVAGNTTPPLEWTDIWPDHPNLDIIESFDLQDNIQ